MQIPITAAAPRWDWRISGHFRVASLISAWILVLFSGVLGPILAPLAAIRFVFSGGQTWLNIRLGRRNPVDRQTRLDWFMVTLIFAGAYVAVGIGHVVGDLTAPVNYVPMLIPFTVLQVRLARRSYKAHRAGRVAKAASVTPFPSRPASESEAA